MEIFLHHHMFIYLLVRVPFRIISYVCRLLSSISYYSHFSGYARVITGMMRQTWGTVHDLLYLFFFTLMGVDLVSYSGLVDHRSDVNVEALSWAVRSAFLLRLRKWTRRRNDATFVLYDHHHDKRHRAGRDQGKRRKHSPNSRTRTGFGSRE